VKKLCDKFFKGLFGAVIGSSESIDKKPSPNMVYKALDIIGCSAGEAVYVGDSEVDIETAKNACMPVIIVGWGFRGKDFLTERGAVNVVTDIGGLEKALYLIEV
jgi:phosphoglycolate phosphatase